MRRLREQITINPIDTQPNVAIGVSLPFNGTPVFNSTYTTKDQIKTNLINYFLTNRGERIFNPEFGGDLRAYIFEQTPQFEQLYGKISDDIEQYFPMISIVNLTVDVNKDNYTVTINLAYSVNNSHDELTIQING
jgi:phage baseplate assembly protein W